MRPLIALLLCLTTGLVRADSPYESVSFDICQLNLYADPPYYRRHPDGDAFEIRKDMIHALADVPKGDGIECTKIGSTGGYTVFVVGSRAEIKKKLGWE